MAVENFGVERQEAHLKNGVKVVSYYKPLAPISIRAAFLAGARYEPENKPGLAHFTEHMIVSGSKRFPARDDMARFFDPLGGNYNASTSTEQMFLTYNIAVADDFPHVVTMMNSCLTESLFDPDILEKERGAVLQERAMRYSNPNTAIGVWATPIAYQGTDLDRTILGTDEAIRAFSRDDVMEFAQTFLRPERMAITVAGDITATEVARQLDKGLNLSSTQDRFIPAKRELQAARNETVRIASFPGNPNVELLIMFRIPGFRTANQAAMYLLAQVVGASRLSRLHLRLRNKEGLVYGIWAAPSYYSDAGTFSIRTSFKKDSLQHALTAIAEELRAVVEGGIKKDDLEKFKSREVKAMRIAMQTSGAWVSTYATDELFDEAKTLEQMLAEVEAVTTKDIQRAAQTYFTNDNWYIAVAGDVNEGEISLKL